MCNLNNRTDTTCSCSSCCCRNAHCLFLAIAIVGALFLLTLGLILGSIFAEAITAALAAVIVLAIALFVIALVITVIAICRRGC